MTAFLTLFRDAWRRARDRKTVVILFILGLLMALVCASIGFGRPVPAESLKDQLTECSAGLRGAPRHGANRLVLFLGAALRRKPTVHVRGPTAEDDLPLGLSNCTVAELELPDLDDFDRVAKRWRDATGETPRATTNDAAPISTRDRGDFLESMLRGHGWETVVVRPREDDEKRFLVAAATDHLADLEGSWQLGILFGSESIALSDVSPAEVVVIIEQAVFGLFAGLIGLLVLLSAFSGAMPDLLQKGQLDLVLARPIGRTRLLFYSYAGAVLTVLLVTASVFLACALTLGLRSGHFSVAFVGCALTTTAIFASLLPVAMLCGYLTRSSSLATLAAMACWGTAEALVPLRLRVLEDASHWIPVVDWAIRLMPKTSDITNLGARWFARTEFSPEAFERHKELLPLVNDPWTAYSSTALFAVVVLLITALLFRRRDC